MVHQQLAAGRWHTHAHALYEQERQPEATSACSKHPSSVQDFLRSVYRVIPLCGVASGKFPWQHAMHVTLAGHRKAVRPYALRLFA